MSILSNTSAKAALCVSFIALASSMLASAAQAMTVTDSELYLSVDASGSIDSREFELQKQGYAKAFRNSVIQELISKSENGIAAALGYWSGKEQQETVVPFMLLKTAQDSTNFAALIAATTRPFNNGTKIGPAIDFAANELLNNQFDGSRLVIDVSGDGADLASTTRAARDAAVAKGITINGLAIESDVTTDFYTRSNVITGFYKNSIQGGTGSFTVTANTFDDFDSAVVKKIAQEIVLVPTTPPTQVPTPALLPGLIGMGVATMRKRKAEAADKA